MRGTIGGREGSPDPWVNLNSLKASLGRLPLYVLLMGLGVGFVLPFAWMVSTSLKLDPQVYRVPPTWIPDPIAPYNYVRALKWFPFGQYFFNTMIYCCLAAVGTVVSSAIAAYGFARVSWRGRDRVFWIVLATMLLPFQVQMVPLYLIFRHLGWLNTYVPLVLPTFLGSAYSIFLLRQFFRSIPSDLSDAARLDGAREVRILVQVVAPLAKPALAVVGLFAFMEAWNNYLGPLIYLSDSSKYTLALGLQNMQVSLFGGGSIAEAWPMLMAASTMVTVPILALYFFMQRFLIQGITVSGMRT